MRVRVQAYDNGNVDMRYPFERTSDTERHDLELNERPAYNDMHRNTHSNSNITKANHEPVVSADFEGGSSNSGPSPRIHSSQNTSPNYTNIRDRRRYIEENSEFPVDAQLSASYGNQDSTNLYEDVEIGRN